MAVLSVDLACRSWADLGVVLLEQKANSIACEVIRWPEPYAPPVVELALRLDRVCQERDAGILMLDGPQAWKSDDNGQVYARVSERELNTPAKTGLPGNVLPGTYERFVGYCLALYEALERLGWQRLNSRDSSLALPRKILIESYPHAAWKSLGIPVLPAKRRCRVSDLAEAFAALNAILPITTSQPPNHDQLQAIVAGLPGLAIERRNAAEARIVGVPPRREAGHWREGFIVLPLRPAENEARTSDDLRTSREEVRQH